MRLLIQRVTRGSVSVRNANDELELISSIGRGIVCLTGINDRDTEEDLKWAAKKIVSGISLWPDSDGRAWKESVASSQAEILLVSQFTLYGSFDKGKKPDFHLAMPPEKAKQLYGKFVEMVRETYDREKVKDGEFGAMMSVDIVNDGPVTFFMESPRSLKPRGAATPPPPPTNKTHIVENVDPGVQLKRLEKKLSKVVGLRRKVESGQVPKLKPEQQAKLASEDQLVKDIQTLKERINT